MHLLFHCGIIAASPPAAIRTIVIKASFVSEHEMAAHLARNELFFDLVWHDFLLLFSSDNNLWRLFCVLDPYWFSVIPYPLVIMGKFMGVMRILMVIISVAQRFSFAIIPSTLNYWSAVIKA